MNEELKLAIRRLLVSAGALLLLGFGIVAHGQDRVLPTGLKVEANESGGGTLSWNHAGPTIDTWVMRVRFRGQPSSLKEMRIPALNDDEQQRQVESFSADTLESWLGNQPVVAGTPVNELVFAVLALDADGNQLPDTVQATATQLTIVENGIETLREGPVTTDDFLADADNNVFYYTGGSVEIEEGPLTEESLARVNDLLRSQRGLVRGLQKFRPLKYEVSTTLGDDVFTVASEDGAPVVSGTASAAVDYENANLPNPFEVTVTETTSGESTTVSVTVTDKNDAPHVVAKLEDGSPVIPNPEVYTIAGSNDVLPSYLITRYFDDQDEDSLTTKENNGNVPIECLSTADGSATGPTLVRTITNRLLVSHELTEIEGVSAGDYECVSLVEATDGKNSSATITLTVKVRVGVNNVPFFAGGRNSLDLTQAENESEALPAGIQVYDVDGDMPVATITGGASGIKGCDKDGQQIVAGGCLTPLISDSGIVTVTSTNLDFETNPVVKYGIKLTDKWRTGENNLPVTLTLTDVNEAPDWNLEATTALNNKYVEIGSPYVFDLVSERYVADPEGRALKIEGFSKNTDYATVDIDGTTATITAHSNGNPEIFFIATDPTGLAALSPDLVIRARSAGFNRAPAFNDPGIAAITFSIPENSEKNTLVGHALSATDPNGDLLEYSLRQDADAFKVDRSGQISVNNPDRINFEDKASDAEFPVHLLRLSACDGLGLCDSVEVTVQISDVNDEPTLAEGVTGIPTIDVIVGSQRRIALNQYFFDEDAIDRDRLRFVPRVVNRLVASVDVEYGSDAEGYPTADLVVNGLKEDDTQVILIASDHENKEVRVPVDITVLPNEAPEIVNPIVDMVINLGESLSVNLNDVFDDDDYVPLTFSTPISSSRGNVLATLVGDSTLTVYARSIGTATVEVSATDGSGETTPTTFMVRVNAMPVVVGSLDDIVVNSDGGTSESIDLAGVFSDPDGDALTLSVESADETIATVALSGTDLVVTGAVAGTTTVTVTATDGVPNSSVSTSFDVLVNTVPIVAREISDLVVNEEGGMSQSIDLSLVFSDADGDDLTYSATSANASVASVEISGSLLVVTGMDAGSTSVTVSATDGYEESRVSTTFNVRVNAIPVVAMTLDNIVVNSNGGTSGEIDLSEVFSDADGMDLTLSVESGDTSIATVELDGMSLVVTGGAAGTTTITVSATDGVADSSVSTSFDVLVNTVPIVARAISDLVVNEEGGMSQLIDLSLVFSDADGDDLTYSATSANASVAVVEISGSLLVVTGMDAGSTSVTVSATDGYEESRVSTTFNVRVNAIPAVAMTLDNIVVNSNGGTSGEIDLSEVFSDADGMDLTLSVESGDTSIATVELDGMSLVVTGGAAGTTTITVSATDGVADSSVSTSFDVLVNTVPIVARAISDLVVNEEGGMSQLIDLSLVFSDADGMELTYIAESEDTSVATVEISGSLLVVTGMDAGSTSVTVSATDGYEESRASTTFNVRVNAIPVVAMTLDNLVVNSDGGTSESIDLAGVFSDPDGDALTLSVESADVTIATVALSGTDLVVTGAVAGTTTITVSATDGVADSSVSTSFDVLVNTVPIVAKAISDLVVNEEGGMSQLIDLSLVFSDADGDDLTYSATSANASVASVEISGSLLVVTGMDAGSTSVTVSATDGYEESRVSTTFNVRVNAIPVVAMTLDNIVVNSNGGTSGEIDLSEVFSDADGMDLTLSVESGDTSIATVELDGMSLVVTGGVAGTTTITVSATDGVADSSVSTSFDVRVNTVPVVVAVPSDQVIQGLGNTSTTVDLSTVFMDADEQDVLMYTASSSDATIASVQISGSMVTVTAVAPGTVTIDLSATDGFADSTAVTSFDVTVKTLPQVAGTIAPVSLQVGGEVATRALASAFSEADGDPLSYTVSLSGTVASAAISGSTLTVSAISHGFASATVTATDPDGNSAMQSVSITVSNSELKGVANDALAAIGRAMLGSTTNAIGTRIAKARAEESAGSSLAELVQSFGSMSHSVDNQPTATGFDSGFQVGAAVPRNRSQYGANPINFAPRQFSTLLGANGAGSFAIWGAGDSTSFEGAGYDGSVTGLHLGADLTTAECWLIGVAVSSSSGEVDFTYGTADRTLETSVTAFTPYVRYEPDEMSAIWAAGSFGSGDADVTGGVAAASSNLDSQLFLVGGRREFSNTGNFNLAIRGEAASGSLSTDDGEDLASGLDVSVSRVRGVLEATFNTGDGGFEPFVDIGFRNDGGDGDTGSGVEVSGGIRVSSDAFSLEARAHTVASHGADDYSENGFSVVARISPNNASGTGFSMTLEPVWGASYQASDLMWQFDSRSAVQHTGQRLYRDQADDGLSFNSRLSYGIAAYRDSTLISPFVDVRHQSNRTSRYLLGAEFKGLTEGWNALSVQAALGAESNSRNGTHGVVGINGRLSF